MTFEEKLAHLPKNHHDVMLAAISEAVDQLGLRMIPFNRVKPPGYLFEIDLIVEVPSSETGRSKMIQLKTRAQISFKYCRRDKMVERAISEIRKILEELRENVIQWEGHPFD